MDIQYWMYMAFGLMIIMLITNKMYPRNYWIQAFWILIGSGCYVEIITIFDGKSVLFPTILLILNLVINIFLIVENFNRKSE